MRFSGRLRVHPARPSQTLTAEEATAIHDQTIAVWVAIWKIGSTIRTYTNAFGEDGEACRTFIRSMIRLVKNVRWYHHWENSTRRTWNPLLSNCQRRTDGKNHRNHWGTSGKSTVTNFLRQQAFKQWMPTQSFTTTETWWSSVWGYSTALWARNHSWKRRTQSPSLASLIFQILKSKNGLIKFKGDYPWGTGTPERTVGSDRDFLHGYSPTFWAGLQRLVCWDLVGLCGPRCPSRTAMKGPVVQDEAESRLAQLAEKRKIWPARFLIIMAIRTSFLIKLHILLEGRQMTKGNWKDNLRIAWFGEFFSWQEPVFFGLFTFMPIFVENLGVGSQQVAFMQAGNFCLYFRWRSFLLFRVFLLTNTWKPLMIRAGLAMTITMGGLAFVPNIYWLIFLRLLNGVFAGFVPN